MKPKMKINFRISVMAMLLAALFVVAHTGQAQRVRPGKVQSLQATVDSGVPHPATAAITEPALLTCMNATSEVPNSKPAPSCHIVAPGFTGNLQKGGDVKLTAAGNVTLTCNGQGPCSAAPPASKSRHPPNPSKPPVRTYSGATSAHRTPARASVDLAQTLP
jgi:hypothetical protein